MLPFKYLLDNRDLAMTILSNWEYDADRLDMMDYFRISANAIYPFYHKGKVCFLRFTPFDEKPLSWIQAELEFLTFLRNKDYSVPEMVLSKDGKEIVVCDTKYGKYSAVVFTSVGIFPHRLDRLEYSDGLYQGYGEMLGRLHLLSKEFKPIHRRPDWREILLWIYGVLKEYKAPDKALQEVSILTDYFDKLPTSDETYGMIHYDFELDNVFYDSASTKFGIIDFDDAMYHWYVTDIVQTTEQIKEKLPKEHQELSVSQFLSGYRSVMNIDEAMLGLSPVFKRFIDLYSYARNLRAISEKCDNEPDWMTELRGEIEGMMEKQSKYFGGKI